MNYALEFSLVRCPKKGQNQRQVTQQIMALNTYLGLEDIYISYELAEFFVQHFNPTKYLRFALPVIVSNICYVSLFENIDTMMQEPSNHTWVLSLMSNPVGISTQAMNLVEDSEALWQRQTACAGENAMEHYANNAETCRRIYEASHSVNAHIDMDMVLAGGSEHRSMYPGFSSVVPTLYPFRYRLTARDFIKNIQLYFQDMLPITSGINPRKLLHDNAASLLKPDGELSMHYDSLQHGFKTTVKAGGQNFVVPAGIWSQAMRDGAVWIDSMGARGHSVTITNTCALTQDSSFDFLFGSSGNQNKIDTTKRTQPKSIPGHNTEKPWLTNKKLRK